jgi:hypothetical protein
MPWKETSAMGERVEFIAAVLEGDETFVELYERFGISRKQGFKWKSGTSRAVSKVSRSSHERLIHVLTR